MKLTIPDRLEQSAQPTHIHKQRFHYVTLLSNMFHEALEQDIKG